jgi:hypothetical protein
MAIKKNRDQTWDLEDSNGNHIGGPYDTQTLAQDQDTQNSALPAFFARQATEEFSSTSFAIKKPVFAAPTPATQKSPPIPLSKRRLK